MFTTRNVLLYLHVIVAFLTLGPLILFDMITPGVVRRGDVGAVRLVVRLTSRLGPATGLILLLGIALVARKDGYEFGDRWIVAAIVIYVLLVLNGAIVLTGLGRKALAKLEAGESAEDEAAKLRVFGLVNIVLFFVIIWLMVAKPALGG
jgi:uncharacterized membrane protein